MNGNLSYAIAFGILLAVARARLREFQVGGWWVAAAAAAGGCVTMYAAPNDPRIGILCAALSICALTDLAFGYIFDRVTVPAAFAIIACAATKGDVVTSLIGASVGAAPFIVLYALTRGRGVGLGDAKLGALIGLALGSSSALLSIGFAFVFGALCACAFLAVRRMSRRDAMPFAPFLACGAASALIVPWKVLWLIG